ncbi:MAG TPA: oxidative damage protection protein [Longimicrobiales bacterium]|nr:oxidative damage protection protein [Longimicrobiales bacterium]
MICVRCGQNEAGLERAPLRNELGERARTEICPECWAEWLRYQTALINHYGLDPREKKNRDFLQENMESFLFRGGDDAEEIDTSKQGSIEW